MSGLTIDQAYDIADRFTARRVAFKDETDQYSLMVVLLNYGDHLTRVDCINGEWSGTKGDLLRQPTGLHGFGIPKCPNGHVLTESTERLQLGLIPQGASE